MTTINATEAPDAARCSSTDPAGSTRRRSIRSVERLQAGGFVRPEEVPGLEAVAHRFSISISPEMIGAMGGAEGADNAIGRQFVPSVEELDVLDIERADPIGDSVHERVKGVVHRYPDRVLLKPISVCAVYCRFCFRREKVGPGNSLLSEAELEAAFEYIRADTRIWEVILTGGDPLVLSNQRLRFIIGRLATIAHLKVIRLHTRVPVADPARVTSDVIDALACAKTIYVVVHCNHRQELTPGVRKALALFVDRGVPVLSQTVLLKGINDSAEALSDLLRALVELRVKPYYLHHGDLAEGTSHFRTSIEEGQKIVRTLRATLSGICQPTYVLDIPGGFGKVPIGHSYLTAQQSGCVQQRWKVEDIHGNQHEYPPRATPEMS